MCMLAVSVSRWLDAGDHQHLGRLLACPTMSCAVPLCTDVRRRHDALSARQRPTVKPGFNLRELLGEGQVAVKPHDVTVTMPGRHRRGERRCPAPRCAKAEKGS